MVVNRHVGGGNRTCSLCNRCKCFLSTKPSPEPPKLNFLNIPLLFSGLFFFFFFKSVSYLISQEHYCRQCPFLSKLSPSLSSGTLVSASPPASILVFLPPHPSQSNALLFPTLYSSGNLIFSWIPVDFSSSKLQSLFPKQIPHISTLHR